MNEATIASIIIPAHNEAHFLPGLMDSLAELRRRPNLEVIVIDSGSTDATATTASDYACRVVSAGKKLPPGTARNLGVAHCNGHVIAFLDADVEVKQEWVQAFIEIIEGRICISNVIVGDQYHISRNPAWIEKSWFEPIRNRAKSYINGGNLIMLREVFDRVGGFTESIETGEDVDFCKKAAAAGVSLMIDQRFAVFHEGFPKTLRRFVLREAWHGKSDFSSIHTVLSSKIAIATIAFALLHVMLLLGFIMGPSILVWLSLALLPGLCIALYMQQMGGRMRLYALPRGAFIAYAYFVGRSMAIWRRMAEG